MELSITNNINSIARGLSKQAKKQVPFAMAKTLTKLAFKAMKEEKRQAPRYLEKPTPFTIRGFKYKKATKRNLISLVYVLDKNTKYMNYAIEGGVKKAAGRSMLHPTANTKLNKYGNIPRKYLANSLDNKAKFFVGIPDGMSGQENYGLWQRHGGKKGKRNHRIKMMATFVKSRRYTAKMPFYRITQEVIDKNANNIFNQEFNEAMRSAR